MTTEDSGWEVDLGEPEWDALDVHRGDVIEAYMPSTDMVEPAEVWAGFLVMQVSVELGNQAMALEVKSLGCPAPELTKTLGRMFNKKPCATANHYELHATRIRIYKLDDFNADYVTRSMKTQIRKWMGGADEEEVERSDVKPCKANQGERRRRSRWNQTGRHPFQAKGYARTKGEERGRSERQGWSHSTTSIH